MAFVSQPIPCLSDHTADTVCCGAVEFQLHELGVDGPQLNLNYTEESEKTGRLVTLRHEGIFMLFVALKRMKCLLLVVGICHGLKMTSRTFLVIYMLRGKGKYRLGKDLLPLFHSGGLVQALPGQK